MLNQKMAGTDGARRPNFLRNLLSYTITVQWYQTGKFVVRVILYIVKI